MRVTAPDAAPIAASNRLSTNIWRSSRRSRRAHCQSNGDFPFTRTGARKHQVREIGARDQQNQRGDREQDPQRIFVFLPKLREAVARGNRVKSVRHVLLNVLGFVGLGNGRFQNRRRHGVELGGRAFDGPSRLEAAHRGKPVAVAHVEQGFFLVDDRLGANRNRDVEPATDLDTEKSGRRNADDRERIAVERDLATDDARVAVVFVLPECVADDCGLRAASAAIVFGGEQTANQRLRLEHFEKIAADEHAVRVARFAAAGEVKVVFRPREDAGEAFLMVADLFPLRIRDVGVAAMVATSGPVMRFRGERWRVAADL